MASSTALPLPINRPNLFSTIAKYTANSKYPTDLGIGTLTPFLSLTRGSMDRTSNAMINGTTNIRPYLHDLIPQSRFTRSVRHDTGLRDSSGQLPPMSHSPNPIDSRSYRRSLILRVRQKTLSPTSPHPLPFLHALSPHLRLRAASSSRLRYRLLSPLVPSILLPSSDFRPARLSPSSHIYAAPARLISCSSAQPHHLWPKPLCRLLQ